MNRKQRRELRKDKNLIKNLPKDISRDTKDFWYIVNEEGDNITDEENRYLINELSNTSSI